MNTETTVTMRIAWNLDTDVRGRVNDTVVKQVDTFIYLGSEMHSERKFGGEIRRRVQDGFKCYQM
jgi:hypothetical protein